MRQITSSNYSWIFFCLRLVNINKHIDLIRYLDFCQYEPGQMSHTALRVNFVLVYRYRISYWYDLIADFTLHYPNSKVSYDLICNAPATPGGDYYFTIINTFIKSELQIIIIIHEKNSSISPNSCFVVQLDMILNVALYKDLYNGNGNMKAVITLQRELVLTEIIQLEKALNHSQRSKTNWTIFLDHLSLKETK